jgi:predicted dithiol-disulfide oxidoreductase (DUF899 family)
MISGFSLSHTGQRKTASEPEGCRVPSGLRSGLCDEGRRDLGGIPQAERETQGVPEAERETRVEKDYVFEGESGPVTLAEMFGGCSQLVIQHIMLSPDWDAACPRCTQFASELTDSLIERLRSLGTAYAMVCRAPYEKIAAYRGGRNSTAPWYSSHGSDFNRDFDGGSFELPGLSCFLRADGAVFHTYSAYARGLDHIDIGSMYLDIEGT